MVSRVARHEFSLVHLTQLDLANYEGDPFRPYMVRALRDYIDKPKSIKAIADLHRIDPGNLSDRIYQLKSDVMRRAKDKKRDA